MFGREPVMWMAAIQAGIALAVGFGLDWTGEQVSLTTAFAAAILALITRQSVTPNTKLPIIILCVLIGSASLSAAGCTARQGHAIATVDDVAHDGLARFDDLLDSSCDAERLNAETCKAVNKLLAPTWHAYVTANRAARAGDVSKIAEFRKAVEALIGEVRKLVSGDLLQLLLPELELAKTQVGR